MFLIQDPALGKYRRNAIHFQAFICSKFSREDMIYVWHRPRRFGFFI